MRASRFLVVCLAFLAFGAPVAAPALQGLAPVSKPTAAPASPTPAPTASGAIEPQTAYDSDPRIAARIRGIFGQLPGLTQVTVRVDQGVVTLGGVVAGEGDKTKAESIAARVAGVVTVENNIARDQSVGSGVAGLKKVTEKLRGLAALLPLMGVALLVALLVGAVGYFIAGLGGLWGRVTRNPFLAELLASAVRFVFVLTGIVLALDMIGAGALLGAVLGGAGVVGLALGFAMKDTIENYVSSLMLSLRQPFQANDKVRIDNCEGRVVRLTTRATILITDDGNHLRVPNSTVFKSVIVNFTRNPHRRFDFVLQIDTKADPAKARHCGYQALKALDFVLDNPHPSAVVKDILYPNIALQFTGWLDQSKTDFGKGRSRAIEAVKRALEQDGLAIPDPVTHVHMMGETPAPRPDPGPSAAKNAGGEENDIAPEHAVTQMVHEERQDASGKKDLLDASRPQE
jgi:small-conductance mechanosensitive channel